MNTTLSKTKWEVVIGLEVHIQLNTKTKIFSGAPTAYGAAPNEQACVIDLGLPGVLPVLNRVAVEKAIRFGLAVGSEINPCSVFARKNYFYPDLPKGYQISQFEEPIVKSGLLKIILDSDQNKIEKTIRITRAHLEEDAGKSLHEDFGGYSGIDLNRAGTPLLEIVSEPDLRSSSEAVAYLKKLHQLVCYLDICDGNLQEGSFRCDANVSIRPMGESRLGIRTEIKNLNSFRFVESAIDFEVQRQIAVLENNGIITQETRLYDSDTNKTRVMRSKEEANDYRYFPEPDLLPVLITEKQIQAVRDTLPELPDLKLARFQKDYNLSEYDASVLTSQIESAKFYEDLVQNLTEKTSATYKLAANWLMGDLFGALNQQNLSLEKSPIGPKLLADLLNRILDQTISGKIAKQIFETLWTTPTQTVDQIIDSQGLTQITDTQAIESVLQQILDQNPTQVEAYRSGKTKLFGFFIGQAMKATQGKVNPEQVNAILKKLLEL